MLFETKEICFITSFELIYQNAPINDFAELKDLAEVGEGSVFTMKEST